MMDAKKRNRYDIENAVHRVDGYWFPKPLEPIETSFARAQAATITKLKKGLKDVENLTLDQFVAVKRIKSSDNINGGR